MTINITFTCDGCHVEAKGTKRPRRHFESINGKGYGFGAYRFDGVKDVAPEGWVPFDPYTGACYCPKCWAEIEAVA